jgi:hypothetical protein
MNGALLLFYISVTVGSPTMIITPKLNVRRVWRYQRGIRIHAILIEIKRQCEKLKIQISIENSIDLSWVTEGSLFCLLLKLWQMNFIFNESVRMFNLAITFIVFISASDNSIATFILYCELHTFRYIQYTFLLSGFSRNWIWM